MTLKIPHISMTLYRNSNICLKHVGLPLRPNEALLAGLYPRTSATPAGRKPGAGRWRGGV